MLILSCIFMTCYNIIFTFLSISDVDSVPTQLHPPMVKVTSAGKTVLKISKNEQINLYIICIWIHIQSCSLINFAYMTMLNTMGKTKSKPLVLNERLSNLLFLKKKNLYECPNYLEIGLNDLVGLVKYGILHEKLD